jgi:uncharacterized protein (TIGR04255 family)
VDLTFIPKQPVLTDPPLKLVICQLRFPRLMGLTEADVRPVQRALAATYGHVEIQRVAGFSLGPAGATPTGDVEQAYRFLDVAKAWTVTLGPNSLSLETTAYGDFTDFARRWHSLASTVLELLDITNQERIGLRYVNELPCPAEPSPEDISRIVIRELVGVVGRHEATQRLLASMQEMRFAQPQGACTFRHGFVPRSEGSAYVLDIDLYDEKPRALGLDNEIQLLASFNHAAYELFRWSVEPDHFATFKPQEVPVS